MNYENHMAIGEQDNETHAEVKLRDEKDAADDAHKRELVHSIFDGDAKEEKILGRTREDWLGFCTDEIVSFENIQNLMCNNIDSSTRVEILQDVRQNSINAILRELGVE